MESERFVEDLMEAVFCETDDPLAFTEVEVAAVYSFGAAGILTCDEGFVVEMADGSVFQVTVVRSR